MCFYSSFFSFLTSFVSLFFSLSLFYLILLINSTAHIVPFLTISSILIDVCIINFIFINSIFNSYNYWYLLSYSNYFTLHYSILLLLTFLLINIFVFSYIYSLFYFLSWLIDYYFLSTISWLFIIWSRHNIFHALYLLSTSFLYGFFCNITFFIPLFIDFFLIFSSFFFKAAINSIEVFTSYNLCYSILFIHFSSILISILFIILLLIDLRKVKQDNI